MVFRHTETAPADFALLVAGATAVSAKHLPVYYLLLQDYVDATRYHGLSVAWTLSIEVTYYALLPGLAWLALATASRLRRRLLPELAIVACFALISVALHVVRPSAPDMILTYTDWFAAGMLLAVASLVLGPRALSRRLAICLWLAAVVLFAAETRLAYGNYGGHLLLIVAAAMIVLPAVAADHCGHRADQRLSQLTPSRSRISRRTLLPSARPFVSRITNPTSGPSAFWLPSRTAAAADGSEASA